MRMAIRPAQTADEIRMGVDLLATVLAREHGEDEAVARQRLESAATGYPESAPEHLRLAWSGEELVGALRITTDTIRIGEARLRLGGLGRPAAAPRHRGRGVHARLVEDALAYLRQQRYHLAALFARPEAYQRFGFCGALAEYFVEVDTAEALTFEPPAHCRPVRPGEVSELQRIHHANDVGVACSVLRVPPHYTSQWGRASQFQVALSAEGRMAAYWLAESEGHALDVKEVGVADYAHSAAVVGGCAQVAAAENLGRIRFRVPPTHPLARFLTQFPSRHVTRYDHGSSGLLAFVDLAETLEGMVPEWENLLSVSAARDLRAELTFCTERGPYRLRASRGAVDVAPTNGADKVPVTERDLLQVLTGYRAVEDLFETRRCCVHPDARFLATALFPRRTPFMWPFDRFE